MSSGGAAKFDERYYASVYSNYRDQNPERKLRFYRGLLERHVPEREGAPRRLLDLGCAFGYFLGTLDSGWRACGVDLSEYALREARQRAPRAGMVLADCASPPLRGPFDAVVSFDVLEHLPDPDRAREFVHRSLAPGGVLIFVVPVYDGPLGPVVRALDRDETHVQKHSREWWLRWARERFDILEWTGIVRYLLAPGLYLHWPARYLRGIAPAIAVVARLRR